MKLKTFTFLKHKKYLFSLIVLMSVSILSALPAYSQVDYYYGINRKGLRVGVGVGATVLQSNWSSNPVGVAGLLDLDYDLNPYFSIGLQGAGGIMTGKDPSTLTKPGKFYYKQDDITFGSGSIGFKLAIGQFMKSPSSSAIQDAIRRIYIGAGVGMVFINATLTPHAGAISGDPGLSSVGDKDPSAGNPDPVARTYDGQKLQNAKTKISGSSPIYPINFGTNIALRGILGSDRLEVNPNFQYNISPSNFMDGYQPSSQINAVNPLGSKVNQGGQAYFIGSITLRFKF